MPIPVSGPRGRAMQGLEVSGSTRQDPGLLSVYGERGSGLCRVHCIGAGTHIYFLRLGCLFGQAVGLGHGRVGLFFLSVEVDDVARLREASSLWYRDKVGRAGGKAAVCGVSFFFFSFGVSVAPSLPFSLLHHRHHHDCSSPLTPWTATSPAKTSDLVSFTASSKSTVGLSNLNSSWEIRFNRDWEHRLMQIRKNARGLHLKSLSFLSSLHSSSSTFLSFSLFRWFSFFVHV